MLRMRARTAAFLSLLLTLSAAVDAQAQDKDKSKAKSTQTDPYAEAIRRALSEYSLGHWSEARAFFATAHALQPSARTLRGLALASYELRSYVEAIGYFERALADKTQALEGRMRDEAEQFLSEARMFVTNVTVHLDPSHAQLKVNDRVMELPADRTLRLDPGTYAFSAEAEGYEQANQNVITRGAAEPLTVSLQLKAATPALSEAPSSGSPAFVQTAPPETPRSNLGPWIVIGASAAVAIAGGVFVGVAAANKSSAESPGAEPSYQEVQDAAARGRTFFPLGFALIGAGAAGIAAGVAWKYWPIFGSSERNVTLTPTGLRLRASF
jgi:tetratricopeptide (TPR) repeat protein